MKLLLVFLLFALPLSAQVGMGQWRLHVPAFRAIDVVQMNTTIFTAYENGVSEYNLSSKELSVWDAVNGISDISITCLGHSSSDNSLFIGYANGNLDKLKDNRLVNIPAIKLADIQGSKRINRIVSHGGSVYVATGFSIVKVDPIKNEVSDTYYPTNSTQGIIDLAFRNDSIFALTEDRLYVGNVNNPALADPMQWTEDVRVPILSTSKYRDIEWADNELYISQIVDGFGQDSVYRLTASGLVSAISESFTMEIRSLQYVSNKLVVNYFDASKLYNSDLSQYGLIYTYGFGAPNPMAIALTGGVYYVADGKYGLTEVNGGAARRIAISGPPKKDFYAMDWQNGKLAIAGGGLSNIFLTYNSSGAYVFEEESWSLYDNTTVPTWSNQNIWDYLAVSINPTNSDELAVGTFSGIPLSIINGSQVDTFTSSNSAIDLHYGGLGWSLVSDVTYDESGNLWVLNGFTEEPLKVYTKDKEWYSFNSGPVSKNKFSKKLVVDYNDNKWFILRDVGLVGYKDAGTISNPSDDQYVILNAGESTGALPSNEVNAVAVDFDNEIWIGTDNGFAVLYNSDGAFDADLGEYNAQRIKLEFEGNVEYVLGATNITDIEVDGANRKWFGTSNAGIILLSPDGLEIIEQHTTENSPIISNNILDLKLDHRTGELYIITDLGLVSYRTDATYGDPDYSNVVVFPNPARPDFDGVITIQGIQYDSDVKITDAAGNLVYKTTSNGGTATWNGRTMDGQKVSSGVYLIWTAPNEGKGRKVGKVVVVNNP